MYRVRQQRDAVTQVQSLGGGVYYDYQLAGKDIHASPPPGPKILHRLIGDDIFAHVETVILKGDDHYTDADLAVLTEFPRLKEVVLEGPDITDEGMTHVAGIPQLRTLSLKQTSVTSDGLARLSSTSDLVALKLQGTTVKDETLDGLDQIPHLRSLHLFFTRLTYFRVGRSRRKRVHTALAEGPGNRPVDAILRTLRVVRGLPAARLSQVTNVPRS